MNDIHITWFHLGIACMLFIHRAVADSKQPIFSLRHVLGWSVIHGASIGQNSLTRVSYTHTHTSIHFNTHPTYPLLSPHTHTHTHTTHKCVHIHTSNWCVGCEHWPCRAELLPRGNYVTAVSNPGHVLLLLLPCILWHWPMKWSELPPVLLLHDWRNVHCS